MRTFDKIRNKKEGLYDPIHEHDSCGLGFIANIKGVASNNKYHLLWSYLYINVFYCADPLFHETDLNDV